MNDDVVNNNLNSHNSKDKIYSNLINNQININLEKKLTMSDLKRISGNLNDDIFGDNCSIWKGSITNINNEKKNNYISFFYKNKKVALHRLLYSNYIGVLNDNEYIKYNCINKGSCCTLKHFTKSCLESSNKYYIKNKKEQIPTNIEININKNNIVSF